LWVNLLRDIQKHFRYQTITSDQLVTFICQRTKTDYTYFFDQYLKHTNLPVLELTFEENETELLVRYRWTADVKDFRMPVRVTTKPGVFSFVYPTTEWKVMKLKEMTEAEFEVDEEKFYIDVKLD
jgi:aminopeptidase N